MHPPSYYFSHSNQLKYSDCGFVPEAPRITARERKESGGGGNNKAGKHNFPAVRTTSQ